VHSRRAYSCCAQDEGPLLRTGDPSTGRSGLASPNGQPLACPGACQTQTLFHYRATSTLTPLLLQSETLDKQFEKPLRQHLDAYRTIVHVGGRLFVSSLLSSSLMCLQERSSSYERALREKSNIIRETEMRNMNRKERSTSIHRFRHRPCTDSFVDLQSFREALTVLQRQVDDLDQLKSQHYEEIIEHEEEVWDVVQGKVPYNDPSTW
jgi:prefoldin subunit 5